MKLQRSDIKELHYIASMKNVLSILAGGILCHEAAEGVEHESVAWVEIQARRARKSVPNGLRLHQYANLYFDARTPMMYVLTRGGGHPELCVLRVSDAVLDLPGVVIADRNAARDYVAFGPSPEGLSRIDKDLVFADRWNLTDEAKGARSAEVLVPYRVPPEFIGGAYVSGEEGLQRFNALGLTEGRLPATIIEHLFYR